MNYRHAYHAGNFADLFKHAVLLRLLDDLRGRPAPFFAVDTHAGAGIYDLSSPLAQRTGEGAAALRLATAADAPALLVPLKSAMAELDRVRPGRLYPGSPWLIGRALRRGDKGLVCELRADDAADLRRAVAPFAKLQVAVGDGWRLAAQAWPGTGAALGLIDPPFEAAQDGDHAARLAGRLIARNRTAVVAVWAPIKDLAGFDALAGAIEDAVSPRPLAVLEARVRPPTDPLRLNGCAMMVVNSPVGLAAAGREAAEWIARSFGGS